ncbi:hypothetical protein DB88DRAFT_487892 [Papiliotrema laurentii]|uniref:Uncharacterized protein n=1 Tax=Papiliotrema laurentii TaxID=5418 RepID=A0AAD9FRY0_PAPLA|nr:hypothetical protein DB88DRAFT_487892 [Papiliotrema laurentii]
MGDANRGSFAKRRASFPSSSSENILANTDKPIRRSANVLIKHGKYVLAGAFGCWWTGIADEIVGIYEGPSGWIRSLLVASVAFHACSVMIFLYLVLFLPYIRGYIPNYPKWQESARLRVIVPLLTASIFLGWSGYVVSLSQAGKRTVLSALKDAAVDAAKSGLKTASTQRPMGLLSAIGGTTALYSLTIGILGFIPTPKNAPVRKND